MNCLPGHRFRCQSFVYGGSCKLVKIDFGRCPEKGEPKVSFVTTSNNQKFPFSKNRKIYHFGCKEETKRIEVIVVVVVFVVEVLFKTSNYNYSQYTVFVINRKAVFDAPPPETHVSIPSDPEKQNLYTYFPTQETEVQHVSFFSLHEVNTETIDFTSSGVRHVEGGWPKDVSASEEDQKLRFRKKIEKDEGFIHSVLQLSTRMEHCIRQNNAVDIYEGYFEGFSQPIIGEDEPVKTVNVIRDPMEGRMVTGLAFSPYPNTKIATAYSSTVFMGLCQNTPKDSFLWDINTSSKPELILKGPSWLQVLEFNPKDPNIIGAGCNNGQVCYWDVRKAGKPQGTTPLEVSHADVVTSFAWLVHKTKYELFTISIDGQVLWWDTRKLTEPTERLDLIEQVSGNLLTATCLEHEPSMPTKFMIGTEQGKVISCNRRAKNPSDKLGYKDTRITSYKGYKGNDHISFPTQVCVTLLTYLQFTLFREIRFSRRIFMTVGDWTIKIWTEDFKESAVLWTTPSSTPLRGGCWSPTRGSIALSVNCSGALQVWDFLESVAKPSTEVQVVDEGLEVVKIQENGQLVAVGSQRGTLTLLRLPERLYTPFNKHEKPAFTSLLDRETRRERVLEARHKEQRLRQKARSAVYGMKRDGAKEEEDLVAKAEGEYMKVVRELNAQMALESEAIVEIIPPPPEEEDEGGNTPYERSNLSDGSTSPNYLQQGSSSNVGATDSDDLLRSSSSGGEPENI
ncbi:Dynein intermediate chain 3, ciliary [Armadillidium vulgare]|nr:Dynein intermediate chain 3, ciliary [Armadillidium vulgare]